MAGSIYHGYSPYSWCPTAGLEYSPAGKLVWSWKQDFTKFSSLQGVIVPDGLDTNFMHVEDENRMLALVKNVQ